MQRNVVVEHELAEDCRNRASGGERKAASPHQSLIDELETAISHKDIGSRAEILRRITDLFAAGSGHFDSQQMTLFDDIMGRLVSEIEISARAMFGERLSAIAQAPPKVSRALALDDSIEVAGPVLRRSDSLDDETLITGAKTKGQQLPIGAVERAFVHDTGDQVLVLAKSLGFGWKTTHAILMLQSANYRSDGESAYFERFKKLRPETARAAIQFYRLRKRATQPKPN
jgi:hypothetical protein